jgi:nitroreductase
MNPTLSTWCTPGKLDERTIRYLLRSALQDPLLHDNRDFAFGVIQNSEYIANLEETIRSGLSSDESCAPVFYGSRTLILILDRSQSLRQIDPRNSVAQNLMFAARTLGLMARPSRFWKWLSSRPGILKELGVGDDFQLVDLIMIGYPGTPGNLRANSHAEIVKWLK